MSEGISSGAVWRSVNTLLSGIGLVLIGVAALLFAASYAHLIPRREMKAPPWELVSPAEHSFDLVQLGEFRRDQFLYDKKTGRVWQSTCSGKVNGPDCDGMVIWEEMYVAGVTPKDSIASALYDFYTRQQMNEANDAIEKKSRKGRTK